MAETVDKVTWISLQAAREIVTVVMLTRSYAGPQIVKWLWQKRVRWTFVKVFGVPRTGWSLDQEARALWDHHPHKVPVDYEQSSAHKPVIFPSGGKGHITIIGVRVAKEDIEAALAADYPNFVPAPLPSSEGKSDAAEPPLDAGAPTPSEPLPAPEPDAVVPPLDVPPADKPTLRQEMILAILDREFPESIPKPRRPTQLTEIVRQGWKAECDRRPGVTYFAPDRKTVMTAVTRWRP
jgi:hypothetical protein